MPYQSYDYLSERYISFHLLIIPNTLRVMAIPLDETRVDLSINYYKHCTS